MLPSTSLAGAATVMERLRDAIASSDFGFREGAGKITMTFGVATLGDDSTIADCIRQADDALYRGKTEGRNRVVCAA
jgi:diguanylate cyclase (GGDEF)-like protein